MSFKEIRELSSLFSLLGLTAFGGPAAHIAMMENEVVEKRKWLSAEHFLDLVGITNLIPGPNSTEVALHIGYERAKFWGMITAGIAFIVPAVALTLLCAWGYVTYGTLPAVQPVLLGIKPVVLVIIALACFKLGKKAIKSRQHALIGIFAAALTLAGFNEVIVLLVVGILGALWLHFGKLPKGAASALILLPVLSKGIAVATQSAAASPTMIKMALFFFKVGAILFGSGYVLVAFLEDELVTNMGWLTADQLLDAIALGQLTPGPVLSTAAFIGYLLFGVPGGVVAACAIFLPSFGYVLLVNPFHQRLRENPMTAKLLDSVNAAVVALIGVVFVRLSLTTLDTAEAWVVAVCSYILLVHFKFNSAIVVLVGGGVGLISALI